MSTKIYPDFFSTFFMFPFSIHPEVDLSEYAKSLEDNGFKEEDYQITHGIDYNELVCFYPYIRDILFQTEKSKGNNKDSNSVTFLKYKIPKKGTYFIVNGLSTEPDRKEDKYKINKQKEVKLPLKNIFLHLFEVGVGILIFEIVNDARVMDEKATIYSVADYLRFIETGRRIFIPFVNAKADLENKPTINDHCLKTPKENKLSPEGIMAGLDAVHKGIQSARIQIQLDQIPPIAADFLKEQILLEKEDKYKPALSKIVTQFLDAGDYNYENETYDLIIDDRMFVHSYFSIADSYTYIEKTSDSKEQKKLLPSSNHNFLEVLKMAFNNGIDNQDINEALELWYQMIFLDWQEPSCANPLMMKNLLKDSTYSRWSSNGGFSGYSRFSSVMISNINEAGFIYNHFQSLYYQIAILLLFYRGAILNFSERSEKLSNSIHDLPVREGENKDTRADLKKIRLEADQLHREFLLFRNKFWFREVTAQDQGIEIFDLWSKQMRNLELMQDVQTEIKELFVFVDSTYEKDVSKTINILTVLGAVAIPLAILTSFFGMNLPFITKLMEDDLEIGIGQLMNIIVASFSIEKMGVYAISALIFIITFLVSYWVIHRIFDFFANKDTISFPKLIELIKAIFKRGNKS